uniref:Uncharacterized protein n=1 Tax=Romanomermis culicivorax TaxID=13658 RepID=A0A915HTU0_ROMCU
MDAVHGVVHFHGAFRPNAAFAFKKENLKLEFYDDKFPHHRMMTFHCGDNTAVMIGFKRKVSLQLKLFKLFTYDRVLDRRSAHQQASNYCRKCSPTCHSYLRYDKNWIFQNYYIDLLFKKPSSAVMACC